MTPFKYWLELQVEGCNSVVLFSVFHEVWEQRGDSIAKLSLKASLSKRYQYKCSCHDSEFECDGINFGRKQAQEEVKLGSKINCEMRSN